MERSTNAARIFLILGLNQNTVNDSGESPLHYAAEDMPSDSSARNHDEILMRLLLEYNAEVNIQDKTGATPLHVACKSRPDKSKLLIERKANVTIPTKNGQTPLHIASTWPSSAELVKSLIQHGAEVNASDSKRDTPLHRATANSRTEFVIIKILVESGANVNVATFEGDTPLHNIAGNNAIQDLRAARYLIEHGADVNAKNKDGDSVLHNTTRKTPLGTYLVALLLQHHADPNAVNNQGESPLFVATSRYSLELVTLLLDDGANVHIRDVHDNNLLHRAVSSLWTSDDLSIIRLFRERGVEAEALNEEGYTPRDLALVHREVKVAALFPSMVGGTKTQ